MKTTPAFTVLLFTFLLSSCHVGRYFIYNFADIRDYKKFPSRELTSDSVHFSFIAADSIRTPKPQKNNQPYPFEDFMEDSKTVAFLIIRNDTLLYEKYVDGYTESSIIPSFSMAKSVTSLLIGCAIDDGLIGSENELVINYIPELKENGFENVTIKHLLQMTSGLDFNESYFNPFGDAAKFYYGRNLHRDIKKMELATAPGLDYNYVSGDTQLLGLVLERALKTESITNYLQRKVWTPLGMEYDASWSLDRENGMEKTFCCLNARARDFAKLGRLYLNKGNWNGTQIVSQSWVEKSTAIDTTEGSVATYQYQWWINPSDNSYMAQGILGQFVYVKPSKNIIIVRLGKAYGGINWRQIFASIAGN